jgi:hypothetical protein
LICSNKTLWLGKRNTRNLLKNGVIKAEENVRQKKREYEEEEAEPDTTEEILAEVEQQQAEAAHERMENATSMTVPHLLTESSDSRNTSKKQ